MCNYRHHNSKRPKRTSGTGYKIFTVEKFPNEIRLKGMTSYEMYRGSSDGWIHWESDADGGFCCVPTKAEALRLFRDWTEVVPVAATQPFTIRGLYKVKYKGAFARHEENNILDDKAYDTLLVKSFKVLEKVVSE